MNNEKRKILYSDSSLWVEDGHQAVCDDCDWTTVVHFSAFGDLATEISAILPRWRLKLSVYFQLGEYYWKDFSSPVWNAVFLLNLNLFNEDESMPLVHPLLWYPFWIIVPTRTWETSENKKGHARTWAQGLVLTDKKNGDMLCCLATSTNKDDDTYHNLPLVQ